MGRLRITAVILALFAVVAALATAGLPASGAAPRAAACSTPWGSHAKAHPGMHTAPLLAVRTGRHACYDRIVFEFRGAATGYRVGYASRVFTEGRGVNLRPYTAGGVLLGVHLRNPTYGPDGLLTYRHRAGDHVANVLGDRTLRDVVFGGSFEGYTTFAVGVRARLPFRVLHLAGPGSHQRIVLDIAHHW